MITGWKETIYTRKRGRPVSVLTLNNAEDGKLAIIYSIGALSVSSKLVSGPEYRQWFEASSSSQDRSLSQNVKNFIQRRTFRAGKVNELSFAGAKKGPDFSGGYFSKILSEYGVKGAKAHSFVTGKLEARPLQKALDFKKVEIFRREAKEREAFYANEETGMF